MTGTMESRARCRFSPLQTELDSHRNDRDADAAAPLSTCQAQEMQRWSTAGNGVD